MSPRAPRPVLIVGVAALAVALLVAEGSSAGGKQSLEPVNVEVDEVGKSVLKPGGRVQYTGEVTLWTNNYTPVGPVTVRIGVHRIDDGTTPGENPFVSYSAPPNATCGDYYVQPSPPPEPNSATSSQHSQGDWVFDCEVTTAAGEYSYIRVVFQAPRASKLSLNAVADDPNTSAEADYAGWLFSFDNSCQRATDAVKRAKKKLQQADTPAAKEQAKKKLKKAKKRKREACGLGY
jgi:hypothetical protein